MSKTIKCRSCKRRLRSAAGWNVEMKAGVPQWYLCPDCQTPEDNTQAEIHDATLSYHQNPITGRYYGTEKVS